MRREMWKRLQRSVIEYRPSWCRATKRARSVMGVVSFQGMKYLHALRSRVLPMYPVQSVTYVTGSYTPCLSPPGGPPDHRDHENQGDRPPPSRVASCPDGWLHQWEPHDVCRVKESSSRDRNTMMQITGGLWRVSENEQAAAADNLNAGASSGRFDC